MSSSPFSAISSSLPALLPSPTPSPNSPADDPGPCPSLPTPFTLHRCHLCRTLTKRPAPPFTPHDPDASFAPISFSPTTFICLHCLHNSRHCWLCVTTFHHPAFICWACEAYTEFWSAEQRLVQFPNVTGKKWVPAVYCRRNAWKGEKRRWVCERGMCEMPWESCCEVTWTMVAILLNQEGGIEGIPVEMSGVLVELGEMEEEMGWRRGQAERKRGGVRAYLKVE